jgi:hypothetical protein
VYYTLVGSTKAQQFFSVDRNNGQITVKANLQGDVDRQASYEVIFHLFK